MRRIHITSSFRSNFFSFFFFAAFFMQASSLARMALTAEGSAGQIQPAFPFGPEYLEVQDTQLSWLFLHNHL